MEIRLRNAGEVITGDEFRALHPTTSFPPQLSVELLDSFDADVVFEGPQPTTTRYQFVARQGVIQMSDGNWYRNYVAIDMPDETKAALDAQQATSVRAERNKRLSACDWTQLADAPVDNLAWAIYRQALRDIPEQPGFPLNITWPEMPK
jgi:Phage tail assembly chaperone protein